MATDDDKKMRSNGGFWAHEFESLYLKEAAWTVFLGTNRW
jgi:hypothetical protein